MFIIIRLIKDIYILVKIRENTRIIAIKQLPDSISFIGILKYPYLRFTIGRNNLYYYYIMAILIEYYPGFLATGRGKCDPFFPLPAGHILISLQKINLSCCFGIYTP